MAKGSRRTKQPAPGAVSKAPVGLEDATGNDRPHVRQRLLMQVCETIRTPEALGEDEMAARINFAVSLFRGIKPAGEVEGMLAAQMVATHHAAMECLRRAMTVEQTLEGRDQNLKHAGKLLSIYSRQIEVLDKHRGKGQQKMTVEHVHVAAGGQAMVGQFDTPETAGARRSEAKPGIKAIPNDPGEILDMDLGLKQASELKPSAPSRKS